MAEINVSFVGSTTVTKVTEKDGRITYFPLGANFSVDENGYLINIQSGANEGATIDQIDFNDLDTASKQGQSTAEALCDFWAENSYFRLQ